MVAIRNVMLTFLALLLCAGKSPSLCRLKSCQRSVRETILCDLRFKKSTAGSQVVSRDIDIVLKRITEPEFSTLLWQWLTSIDACKVVGFFTRVSSLEPLK